MTHSKMGVFVTPGITDSTNMVLSTTTLYHYAECRCADCHYAECHYAQCHFAQCRYAECHYAEFCQAECRIATLF